MGREDTELMLLVRAGGDGAVQAFEELVERHHGALISFFYRKAWNRDEAHDRAQEVLIKVWNSRNAYEPRASFRTYLFQIARNHWIDVVRARKVRPRYRSLDAPISEEHGGRALDLCDDGEAGPPELAERRELQEHIARAVASLGTGHREVWELAQIEGLRYSEIAGILDIPVGTVKSRHHHAVRRLRELLLQDGVDATGVTEGGPPG